MNSSQFKIHLQILKIIDIYIKFAKIITKSDVNFAFIYDYITFCILVILDILFLFTVYS